jgi:hypothetical protein
MLARPSPGPTTLLGTACMRPVQWRTLRDVSPDSRGIRALYARILWDALLDAGLVPRRCRTRPAVRTLAQRWLAGELDAAVRRAGGRRVRGAQVGCYGTRRGRAEAR